MLIQILKCRKGIKTLTDISFSMDIISKYQTVNVNTDYFSFIFFNAGRDASADRRILLNAIFRYMISNNYSYIKENISIYKHDNYASVEKIMTENMLNQIFYTNDNRLYQYLRNLYAYISDEHNTMERIKISEYLQMMRISVLKNNINIPYTDSTGKIEAVIMRTAKKSGYTANVMAALYEKLTDITGYGIINSDSAAESRTEIILNKFLNHIRNLKTKEKLEKYINEISSEEQNVLNTLIFYDIENLSDESRLYSHSETHIAGIKRSLSDNLITLLESSEKEINTEYQSKVTKSTKLSFYKKLTDMISPILNITDIIDKQQYKTLNNFLTEIESIETRTELEKYMEVISGEEQNILNALIFHDDKKEIFSEDSPYMNSGKNTNEVKGNFRENLITLLDSVENTSYTKRQLRFSDNVMQFFYKEIEDRININNGTESENYYNRVIKKFLNKIKTIETKINLENYMEEINSDEVAVLNKLIFQDINEKAFKEKLLLLLESTEKVIYKNSEIEMGEEFKSVFYKKIADRVNFIILKTEFEKNSRQKKILNDFMEKIKTFNTKKELEEYLEEAADYEQSVLNTLIFRSNNESIYHQSGLYLHSDKHSITNNGGFKENILSLFESTEVNVYREYQAGYISDVWDNFYKKISGKLIINKIMDMPQPELFSQGILINADISTVNRNELINSFLKKINTINTSEELEEYVKGMSKSEQSVLNRLIFSKEKQEAYSESISSSHKETNVGSEKFSLSENLTALLKAAEREENAELQLKTYEKIRGNFNKKVAERITGKTVNADISTVNRNELINGFLKKINTINTSEELEEYVKGISKNEQSVLNRLIFSKEKQEAYSESIASSHKETNVGSEKFSLSENLTALLKAAEKEENAELQLKTYEKIRENFNKKIAERITGKTVSADISTVNRNELINSFLKKINTINTSEELEEYVKGMSKSEQSVLNRLIFSKEKQEAYSESISSSHKETNVGSEKFSLSENLTALLKTAEKEENAELQLKTYEKIREIFNKKITERITGKTVNADISTVNRNELINSFLKKINTVNTSEELEEYVEGMSKNEQSVLNRLIFSKEKKEAYSESISSLHKETNVESENFSLSENLTALLKAAEKEENAELQLKTYEKIRKNFNKKVAERITGKTVSADISTVNRNELINSFLKKINTINTAEELEEYVKGISKNEQSVLNRLILSKEKQEAYSESIASSHKETNVGSEKFSLSENLTALLKAAEKEENAELQLKTYEKIRENFNKKIAERITGKTVSADISTVNRNELINSFLKKINTINTSEELEEYVKGIKSDTGTLKQMKGLFLQGRINSHPEINILSVSCDFEKINKILRFPIQQGLEEYTERTGFAEIILLNNNKKENSTDDKIVKDVKEFAIREKNSTEIFHRKTMENDRKINIYSKQIEKLESRIKEHDEAISRLKSDIRSEHRELNENVVNEVFGKLEKQIKITRMRKGL